MERDANGRLPAGSVPGWGVSWWLEEQGLLARWRELTPRQRFDHAARYWSAVSDGWQPKVPPEAWAGTHHPWDPED